MSIWTIPIEPMARSRSMLNLKQLAFAMHMYHDRHKRLPPAAITDAKGRPLLSWRVAILPYIDQEPLYRQFKLDEPWDSPHNITLLEKMPDQYYPPMSVPRKLEPHTTFYQVLVGPGTAFESGISIHLFKDIPDGSPNTILIVEAARPVPWTKPEDVLYEPDQLLPALGGIFTGKQPFFMFGWRDARKILNVALGDGSVRSISLDGISDATLRRAIVRNDGEELGPDF